MIALRPPIGSFSTKQPAKANMGNNLPPKKIKTINISPSDITIPAKIEAPKKPDVVNKGIITA